LHTAHKLTARATEEIATGFKEVERLAQELDEALTACKTKAGSTHRNSLPGIRKRILALRKAIEGLCGAADNAKRPLLEALMQRFSNPFYRLERDLSGAEPIGAAADGMFGRVADALRVRLTEEGFLEPDLSREVVQELTEAVEELLEALRNYGDWARARRHRRGKTTPESLMRVLEETWVVDKKLTAMGFGYGSPWIHHIYRTSPHRELRDLAESMETLPFRQHRNTWSAAAGSRLYSVAAPIDQIELVATALNQLLRDDATAARRTRAEKKKGGGRPRTGDETKEQRLWERWDRLRNSERRPSMRRFAEDQERSYDHVRKVINKIDKRLKRASAGPTKGPKKAVKRR